MRTIVLAIAIAYATAVPALAQDAGWIGVSIEDQQNGGPIIRQVAPNSPADKAGLRPGDVIIEFNKEQVIGVQQLTRLVRETPVGRTVDVKVMRNGTEQTFQVTAERGGPPAFGNLQLNLPNVDAFRDRLAHEFPRLEINATSVQAGIHVQQLTDQLRDFFGVFSNEGVLVTSVDADSAGEKAGLKAGDVIVAINGRSIRTPADFNREMRAQSKPTLKIFREKQEQDIRL